jgi:hypothetical protein
MKVTKVDAGWMVSLDNFELADSKIPCVLVFPREQDAHDFVRRVNSGLSATDAIAILWKGAH